jgi:hypothetical protein
MLLEDGMADYMCLMLPAGDMTIDESRRTLDLFVTEVQPQLQQPASDVVDDAGLEPATSALSRRRSPS